MSTLIVGERANTDEPFSERWRDHAAWYREATHRGAFKNQPRSWQRLALLGVIGQPSSMNLCFPGKGDMNVAYADQVAMMVSEEINWDRIVLCGRRVAKCFGIDSGTGYLGQLLDGRFVVIPHPSGKSRWWNGRDAEDPALVLVREMTLRALARPSNDSEATSASSLSRCKICDHPIFATVDIHGYCPVHEHLGCTSHNEEGSE